MSMTAHELETGQAIIDISGPWIAGGGRRLAPRA
jgi:hypothetical protein